MIDDEELLTQLRSTDEVARGTAIIRLRKLLLRGLSKSLNNRYGQAFSAEDIVQDALLKILSSLDQFQGRSKFTTWAMTVATRMGISSLRRSYHKDVSMESFQNEDGYKIEFASSPSAATIDLRGRSELLEKLQQLINNDLTDKQREAMRAFLAGFSTDGIAERVGTNRNAVYKLIHDARVKLRDGFERDGVSADDFATTFA
jgi:RNA polymerase sigma factor (sigma-70 family)